MPESSPEASVSATRRVAIIGGGISGLTAAWDYHRRCPEARVDLFEAQERLGGVLGSTRIDDWLIESSADMMTTQPDDGWRLCEELDLTPELLPTNTERRGALVYRRGRLYRVPEGFSLMASADIWPLLKSGLLSWWGKLRLATESWRPARSSADDESFEAFAIRRCGREAYEYLIRPLVSGIYTADPAKLSMQATALSRFDKMEQEFGSLTKAMRHNRLAAAADREATGARYGMFVAPRGGMQQLIDRLAERCGAKVHLGCPVSKVEPLAEGTRWRLTTDQGAQEFDELILACAAPAAARLLASGCPALSERLAAIEHASCAVVVLALPQPSGRPNAFGLVVPTIEGRQMLAASFSSHKFAGRSPQDGLLIRVFLGGALNEAIVEESDEQLIQRARQELREVARIEGEPEVSRVIRWRKTMPQYHVGHRQRVAAIEEELKRWPHLALAGNAFHGVGIPDCVRSGRQAVDRLIQSRVDALRATDG